MPIDKKTLESAKYNLDKDLGDISDLSRELTNSIANIYYEYFHNFEIDKGYKDTELITETMLCLDVTKIESLHCDIKFSSIKQFRIFMDSGDEKIVSFQLLYLLDLYKYRIKGIRYKPEVIKNNRKKISYFCRNT
jgi:hypothetical protein